VIGGFSDAQQLQLLAFWPQECHILNSWGLQAFAESLGLGGYPIGRGTPKVTESPLMSFVSPSMLANYPFTYIGSMFLFAK